MVGDRYGTRPIPRKIPSQIFEAIKLQITDKNDIRLLTGHYKLDSNAVPPVYILQISHLISNWKVLENDLRRIITENVQKASSSGILTSNVSGTVVDS